MSDYHSSLASKRGTPKRFICGLLPRRLGHSLHFVKVVAIQGLRIWSHPLGVGGVPPLGGYPGFCQKSRKMVKKTMFFGPPKNPQKWSKTPKNPKNPEKYFSVFFCSNFKRGAFFPLSPKHENTFLTAFDKKEKSVFGGFWGGQKTGFLGPFF